MYAVGWYVVIYAYSIIINTIQIMCRLLHGACRLSISLLLPLILIAIGKIVSIQRLLLLLPLRAIWSQLIAIRGWVWVLNGGICLQRSLPVATLLAPILAMVFVMVLMMSMFDIDNLVRNNANTAWSEKHHRKYQRAQSVRAWILDCIGLYDTQYLLSI